MSILDKNEGGVVFGINFDVFESIYLQVVENGNSINFRHISKTHLPFFAKECTCKRVLECKTYHFS